VQGGELPVLVLLELLQQQERAGEEEGVGWLLGGDGGDGVAILSVESPQHVQHQGRLRHRLSEIAESVGELLQLGGVLRDAEIALVQLRYSASR
jgi:hypothetical protein